MQLECRLLLRILNKSTEIQLPIPGTVRPVVANSVLMKLGAQFSRTSTSRMIYDASGQRSVEMNECVNCVLVSSKIVKVFWK